MRLSHARVARLTPCRGAVGVIERLRRAGLAHRAAVRVVNRLGVAATFAHGARGIGCEADKPGLVGVGAAPGALERLPAGRVVAAAAAASGQEGADGGAEDGAQGGEDLVDAETFHGLGCGWKHVDEDVQARLGHADVLHLGHGVGSVLGGLLGTEDATGAVPFDCDGHTGNGNGNGTVSAISKSTPDGDSYYLEGEEMVRSAYPTPTEKMMEIPIFCCLGISKLQITL